MAPKNEIENREESKPFDRRKEYPESTGYKTGSGDKNSPMATGSGEYDVSSENANKEAQQPGGGENAAGQQNADFVEHKSKGSEPIPTEKINKGE